MKIAVGLTGGLVAAAAGCMGVAAPAQTTSPRAPAKDCAASAQTTIDMRVCAASDARAADARLNKAYADLLRYVDGAERAQLVAAQRAWLVFRDKDCAFFGAGNGTIAPVNDSYCRAQLSNARAKELESWPPNAPRDAINPIR